MASSLNIVSLDPGVTTGVAIARFTVRVDQLSVYLKLNISDQSPAVTISRIRTMRCRIVLMEQKPAHPSKEGLDTWENLYHRLLVLGFNVSHNLNLDQHKKPVIFFIQPSQWKPFMASRKPLLPPQISKHERDALGMLHYFLQINYLNKEIQYE